MQSIVALIFMYLQLIYVDVIIIITACTLAVVNISAQLHSMCDKIKVFKLYFKYYGRYLHLYLITALTKVIAIVFVFENFIVFVIVFKYYAMYLDPSLLGPDTYVRIRIYASIHKICHDH